MPNPMFCPRCGREFSDEVGFCRDCGLSLDGVTKIVTGEADTAPTMKSGPNFALMRIGFAVFILGLVIALGNAALAGAFGFSEVYGTTIFLLMVSAGMAILAGGVIFPRKRYIPAAEKKGSIAGSPTPARLAQPVGGAIDELPVRDVVFVPNEPASVTENTTRNLS